jgi:hypothetical protein
MINAALFFIARDTRAAFEDMAQSKWAVVRYGVNSLAGFLILLTVFVGWGDTQAASDSPPPYLVLWALLTWITLISSHVVKVRMSLAKESVFDSLMGLALFLACMLMLMLIFKVSWAVYPLVYVLGLYVLGTLLRASDVFLYLSLKPFALIGAWTVAYISIQVTSAVKYMRKKQRES